MAGYKGESRAWRGKGGEQGIGVKRGEQGIAGWKRSPIISCVRVGLDRALPCAG